MKKKALIVIVISLFLLGNLSAETFRFLFTKGEKYRFVSTVTEKALLNGELLNYAEFLNKIAVEVLDVKANTSVVSAIYQVSERAYNMQTSYTLQEEYDSNYSIDSRGRHTVNPKYLFPLTRNIPLFPESDIKPGFSWSAPGEEVHDLNRLFGITEPYKIPIKVEYVYLGNKLLNNHTIAEIKITYNFFRNMIEIKPNPEFQYPKKVAGEITVLFFWDIDKGKPHSFEENFDIIYFLASGDTIEFIGIQKCEIIDSPVLDKKGTTNNITKEIEKEKLEGVRVEESERGIKITLENIQFEPDSDIIDYRERGKLERIAGILKKYPERDILVVGHTAGMGTEEYLQDLSMRRAKSVGDFLLSLGARQAHQMTIIGKGASEPIADNSSEDGRKKNRRVEIFILEN